MKIILTGSTGFIGHEILTQCLRNPHITSIIALSQRPLPTNNPKLTVRLVDGFLTYPESLLQELRGAEACIWYTFPTHLPYRYNKYIREANERIPKQGDRGEQNPRYRNSSENQR